MTLEILATGLQFPEGPVVFDDGSVVFVEIKSGNLTRYWNGKTETIVHLDGGPNGAALGPDGAINKPRVRVRTTGIRRNQADYLSA